MMGYEAPMLLSPSRRGGRPATSITRPPSSASTPSQRRSAWGSPSRAPLSGVSFAEDRAAGRFAGRVSILALVKDAEGDVVARLGRDYVLEGPLAELPATRARRVTFSQGLTLAPGTYTVDTAVHDGFGGRIGCRRTSFVVAPPNRGATQIGSLVRAGRRGTRRRDEHRGRRSLPRRRRALHAAARGPGPPRHGDDGLALFYVVRIAPGAVEPPAATLEIGREGRVEKRGSIVLPAADARGRIAHVASIPTAGCAPGAYTLRLSVSQGGSSATEEVRVEVPSRRGPARAAADAGAAGR